MLNTLIKSDFIFPKQKNVYKGKVRDVYYLEDNLVVMVASDRISAFDVVMPRGIPYKGQILNQIAVKMMNETNDIVPNWLIDSPDPNVSIGHLCKPFKIEMVIRGYLSGHASREYKKGNRIICGVSMPEEMNENDKFPEPIITPATKAEFGNHDEDISKQEIINRGLVSKDDYEILENYTKLLFERGSQLANDRGLILVDTKYEFGKTIDGKQLSKEFVRQWLISNNFQGLQGQKVPEMSDEYIVTVSDRYIELFENITSESFVKSETKNISERVFKNTEIYLNSYFGF